MAVLENLKTEIKDYAKNYLKVHINPISLGSNQGSVWNPNEVGVFSIDVENTGMMDVSNLKLHLNSKLGCQIKFFFFGVGSNWGTHLETPLNYFVPADSTVNIWLFQFKAGGPHDRKEVLETHISQYDVSFNHMLEDTTGHGFAPKDTLSLEIHEN